MDGLTDVTELREIAKSASGAPPIVDDLLARLEASGCLATTLPPAPPSGEDPDLSLRRALVLLGRGIEGPARRVLWQAQSAQPGQRGVREVLAVLEGPDAGSDGDRAELQALAKVGLGGAGLAPLPARYTHQAEQPPARLGKGGRTVLRLVLTLGLFLGVLAIIPVRTTVYATAVLRPEQLTDIRITEGGTLLEVLRSDGDRVARGEVLARLDPGEAQATVAVAAAELERRSAGLAALERGTPASELASLRAGAIARASDARRAAAECGNLTPGVHAQARIDECRRRAAAASSAALQARARLEAADDPTAPEAIAAARAEVAAAGDALAAARDQLSARVIRSPAAGVLIAPRFDQMRGSRVRPGDSIAAVAAGSALEAIIRVPPSDAGVVRVGAPVVVRGRGLGQNELQGRVTAVPSVFETLPDRTVAVLVRARVRGPAKTVTDLRTTAEIAGPRGTLLGTTYRGLVDWFHLRVAPSIR
jgi:multidrug resistance efflux pump